MALQKQTISLNLSNGVDQKSDDKVGPENSFSYVRDVIFDKIGKLYKRFGTDFAATSSYYPLSNPLTIGASEIPSNVIGFKDQRLLINKGVLYSQYGSDNKWYFKGHHYPIAVDKSVIHSNQDSSAESDSATMNGITAYAYIETSNSTFATSYVRLSVTEEATGNFVLDNVLIDTSSGTLANPKIVKFSNGMFVTWRSNGDLKIANIPTSAGVAISTNTLFSDLMPATYSDPLYKEGNIDWVFVNKAGVGERNFGAYYTTGNAIKVFSITSAGIVDTTMGTSSTTDATLVRGMAIHYNGIQDKIYVGFNVLISSIYNVNVYTFSFTTTSITPGPLIIVSGTSSNTPINNLAFCDDPVIPGNTWAFWDDFYSTNSFGGAEVVESVIYRRCFNSSGVVDAGKTQVMRGMAISAKPIADLDRKTIYLPAMTLTLTQSTNFILDVFRGRSDSQPNIIAKFNYGLVSGSKTFRLPSFNLLAGKKYFFSLTANMAIQDSFGGTKFRTGISRAAVEFNPQYAASNVTINNAVYLSGGYIGYYDGSDCFEHGFFVNPEPVALSQLVNTGKGIVISVAQQGSASLPEITQVTFQSASILNLIGSVGPSNYWTFVTPTTTFIVWYKINGSGSAPAAAGTKIQVDLTGYETAEQVQVQTRKAILAATNLVTIIPSISSTFALSNAAVGSVADATVTGMTNGFFGGLTAGNYQYSAIYYYIDVNGQIIRSAPSTPATVKIDAVNTLTSVTVWAPPITNKNISRVIVQMYRTLVNGTTLHKVGDVFSYDVPMSQARQQVAFVDTASDNVVNTGEILYTGGGVLGNYSPGATRHLSVFKNRIIATDEDLNSVIYSKTSIQGNPVEFAEELSVDLIDDADSISGHIQLDDKLIVSKNEKLYYLAGDGANDLGQGSSFTLPTEIPSDTGTVNHNTLVKYPLGIMYMSEKGIYLLDRSLQVSYIGKNVDDFKLAKISKAILLKEENQVRFLIQDSDVCLAYDYLLQKWSIFSQYGGTDATVFGDLYSHVASDGVVKTENKSKWIDGVSSSYSHRIKTNWLQIKNVQDYQRIYRLVVLGDLKSAHTLNFKIYYNYDSAHYDEYNFDSTKIDDGVYEPMIHLSQQKCDAIQIEMTVIPNGGSEQCLELVDLSFLVGVKAGLMKVKSEKRI